MKAAAVLLALLVAETLTGSVAASAAGAAPQGSPVIAQASPFAADPPKPMNVTRAFNGYCTDSDFCQLTIFLTVHDHFNLMVVSWGCESTVGTTINDSLGNTFAAPDLNVSVPGFDVVLTHTILFVYHSDTLTVACKEKSPLITMELEEVSGLGTQFAVDKATGVCTFLCDTNLTTSSSLTLPTAGSYFAVGVGYGSPGCNCTFAGDGYSLNVVYSDFFVSSEYSTSLGTSTDFPLVDGQTPRVWLDGGVIFLKLSTPAVAVNPLSAQTGTGATLFITTPFQGGTPPFTCQWFETPPGMNPVPLGSSFGCLAGTTPSHSTGALQSPGTWSFSLQVNDSSPTPLSVMSAPAKLVVGPVAVYLSCSPTHLTVGGTTICKATIAGSTTTGLISWTSSASGRFSSRLCKLQGGACKERFTSMAAASSNLLTATFIGPSERSLAYGIVSIRVDRAKTGTMVACSPSVSFGGGASLWRCSAIISGFYPTGRVSWYEMGGTGKVDFITFNCSAARGRCTITLKGVSPGPVVIQAQYAGDKNNGASSGRGVFTVPTIRNSTSTSTSH